MKPGVLVDSGSIEIIDGRLREERPISAWKRRVGGARINEFSLEVSVREACDSPEPGEPASQDDVCELRHFESDAERAMPRARSGSSVCNPSVVDDAAKDLSETPPVKRT